MQAIKPKDYEGATKIAEPEVFVVADNILSPLGKTTAENFSKLKQNISGVKQHQNLTISSQPFYASLFNGDKSFIKNSIHDYTKFEQLLIASTSDALQGSGINVADKKTVLIISSTKGNISLLETEENNDALKRRVALSTSAKLVAEYFGFLTQPVIISNACISGVLAIITGMRLLRSGQYENAVIAGADVITKFILSGFESFQALSPQICKPFDRARDGLNLGEGAGTIILSTDKKYRQNIKVKGGSVSNDANHISGPSRTGEELACAIKKAIEDADVSAGDINFISAHGTATVYNDEMEANAFALSRLQSVPLNSLKAYYGHTLGAAGLIESIVSIQSMKESLVLPTLGFKDMGVTNPLNICTGLLPGNFKNCLKTASGFGGCNAAVIFGKDWDCLWGGLPVRTQAMGWKILSDLRSFKNFVSLSRIKGKILLTKNHITASCSINKGAVFKNGVKVFENTNTDLAGFFVSIYQHFQLNYPKYYKMDNLSKLGWLASEILLKDDFKQNNYQPEETGIVLANANSSLDDDIKYFDSTKDIASPSLFVYTLPNIVIGEICIRNNFKGEHAFFIQDTFDAGFIVWQVNYLLDKNIIQACICGWVDVLDQGYKAALFLVEKKEVEGSVLFSKENMESVFRS